MAHVGQEIALGPVGLFGGFFRQPQFVFAAAQFGGGAFQFGVGNGEFAARASAAAVRSATRCSNVAFNC